MELPTRIRRKRSFDAHAGGSSRFSRHRLVWICLACLLIAVIHSVFFPSASLFRATSHPQHAFPHASSALLLDGKHPVTHSLPSLYPNGYINKFACDLPSLRYQCDMNTTSGCQAYPQLFPTGQLMRNWSPNDTTIPRDSFSSICRFNVSSPYEFALARVFQAMEVPFITYGIPELTAASHKWSSSYLEDHLRGENDLYKVHISNSTHFLFFTRRMAQPDQLRPYEMAWLSYSEFLTLISQTATTTTRSRYYYFLLRAEDIRDRASFITKDLAFLDPDTATTTQYGSFFIRDPSYARNKGMRCRLGMAGIITEGHVDAGFNMVAVVQGHKRYILSPPSVCKCLGMYTSGPSMRHTSVDWASITDRVRPQNAKFYDCPATEVVVGPGDVLYIPSYWYHHIVSLDHTIQCNVRSGVIARPDVKGFLAACGLTGF